MEGLPRCLLPRRLVMRKHCTVLEEILLHRRGSPTRDKEEREEVVQKYTIAEVEREGKVDQTYNTRDRIHPIRTVLDSQ